MSDVIKTQNIKKNEKNTLKHEKRNQTALNFKKWPSHLLFMSVSSKISLAICIRQTYTALGGFMPWSITSSSRFKAQSEKSN